MRITRLLAPAILVAAIAAGPHVAAQGVSGPYLAAQQAERRGDVASAAAYYARALARDGSNLAILGRAMTNHIAAGNVTQGITLAERYEEQAPGHHLGVLALTADALRVGDLERADQLMQDGGPFVAQVIRAWVAAEQGDLTEARRILTVLEATDENGRQGKIVAATHMGLILAARDNDEDALASFERANAMTDTDAVSLIRAQAGALMRLGRTDEALAVINGWSRGAFGDASLDRLAASISAGEIPQPTVRSVADAAADVLFSVARLLVRGQNRDISLAYAQLAAFLDPGLTESKLLVAQIFDAGRQYELAIAAYDRIPADAPEAMNALIGKAEVMFESGAEDEAIVAMESAVGQFPGAIEVHTALGDLYRRAQRFEEAVDPYDVAINLIPEVTPDAWPLFYRRGIVLERSQQWERAEADFRLALELEPDQPDVLNYLGYSLVELGQKLHEAEEMIRKAVEQRPDDGYIVDSLGWVYYRFGEFDAAVETLERAVELRPTDPVINDHFGDALWMVGRQIEARFQWKRALSFDPDEKDADRIRRKLKIGLDVILAEEAEAGKPGIIGRQTENEIEPTTNDGG